MRSVLVGTVESTRAALHALGGAGAAPSLLVTLPPECSGRHSDYVDLAFEAGALGVEVLRTASVNAAATVDAIAATAPDCLFVIGWSGVCREPVLNIARCGAIGFHPAPLPHMRGRAVIPWTILQREEWSGSTLFWLARGIDDGPILLQRRFRVGSDETARSLYDKHMSMLRAMLPKAVELLHGADPPRSPQDESLATYCARRVPADGEIDWTASAADILLLIRAVGPPYPGAYTYCGPHRLVVQAAEPRADGGRYIGLAGQIQEIAPEGLIVRCGDGECLTLTRWSLEDGPGPKRHQRLGGAPR
jgi:methionyl-tRNA formyltransferase